MAVSVCLSGTVLPLLSSYIPHLTLFGSHCAQDNPINPTLVILFYYPPPSPPLFFRPSPDFVLLPFLFCFFLCSPGSEPMLQCPSLPQLSFSASFWFPLQLLVPPLPLLPSHNWCSLDNLQSPNPPLQLPHILAGMGLVVIVGCTQSALLPGGPLLKSTRQSPALGKGVSSDCQGTAQCHGVRHGNLLPVPSLLPEWVTRKGRAMPEIVPMPLVHHCPMGFHDPPSPPRALQLHRALSAWALHTHTGALGTFSWGHVSPWPYGAMSQALLPALP